MIQTIIQGSARIERAILDDGVIGIVKIPITVVAATTEQDTNYDLPANSVIVDCVVKCRTAEVTGTTKTIDVGILSTESGGDADGLLDGVDVSATGIKRGVVTITSGTWASTTRGALLREFVAGTNADDRGLYSEKYHVVGSASRSISYSLGSNNFAEFVGEIWITYLELPT